MLFSALAQSLEQLEKTASRLEITRLLAELFKKATPGEIDKICYLSLGQLAPKYVGLEFQLAEKMMIRAVAQATDKDQVEVQKRYKNTGDLGEVVVQVKSAGQKSNLSVKQVYDALARIAQEAGSGSQERKLKGMAQLLHELDPLSAKFVARIPVKKLRLGFSDLTIIDALSWSKTGDKTLRPKIEAAFNVVADIGRIATVFKKQGLRGIKKIGPEVGVPIRAAKAVALHDPQEILEKMSGRTALEPKYDGFRCITGFSPVYLLNKGFISIKDAKVGDQVLTHNGEFCTIRGVNKRRLEKREELFKLQSFLGQEIKITGGHKILVSEDGIDRIWKPVEKLSTKDWLIFPRPKFSPSKGLGDKLELKDGSGYQKTVFLDKDFFRFLGFWIGDGFTNDFHNTERIGLIFNAKTEKALGEEYKQIIKRTLHIENITETVRKGALTIYWRDKPFKAWLTRNFRKEWKGKTLPPWFVDVSSDNFKAFIRGWAESDGTERHSNGLKIVTKERDLAAFAQLLALRHKIIIGLRRERIKLPYSESYKEYYNLIIPGTRRNIKIIKDTFLVRLLRVEKIKKRDPRINIYNLQVEKSKSYCTSLISLHNCQIHIDRSRKFQLEDSQNLGLFEDKQHFVRIFSRNLDNTTYMFPDVVAAVEKLPLKNAILDGEAIAIDTKTGRFLPFQETVQRKRKHNVAQKAKEIPLKVFLFDLLFLNGRSLLRESFRQRRLTLEKLLGKGKDSLVLTEQRIVSETADFEGFFQEMVKNGLEGLMAKKLDAAYQAGARNFVWIKYKAGMKSELADTIDCIVMGYYRGRGKRNKFGIGAFLVGIPNGKDKVLTVSKIGTGLTDAQWREMHHRAERLKVEEMPREYQVAKTLKADVWCRPGLVVEIEADTITRSPIHTAGLALRFPRLKRFRDDKEFRQATSLKELTQMVKLKH